MIHHRLGDVELARSLIDEMRRDNLELNSQLNNETLAALVEAEALIARP